MRHKALSLWLAGLLFVAGTLPAVAQHRDTAWVEATAPPLGMSFQVPPGWTVAQPEFEPAIGRYGYIVTITPPATDPADHGKIEVVVQDYEIRDDQTVQVWVDRMLRTSPFSPTAPNVVVADQSGRDPNAPSRSELIRTHLTWPAVRADAVWIVHGRIVTGLIAYDPSDRTSETLGQIAESVRFATDAPASLDDLYQTHRAWLSVEDGVAAAAALWPPSSGALPCDLTCQDEEAARMIVPGDQHPGGAEFDDQEQRYIEWLEAQGFDAPAGARPEGQILSTRRALPSDWWAPIQVSGTTTKNASCISSWHGGDSAMAIDIQGVGTTTSVYAAQGGTVSATGWDPSGYGNYVVVSSSAAVAGESRTYQHLYAHLSRRDVNQGDPASRGSTRLGLTGSTGNSTGPHLHFHIRLNGYPVDLSPMSGFTPNTNYPTGSTCGVIESRANSPIIIEPVMFSQRYQPRSNHYWFCYTDLNRTTECFMKGMPDDESGWDPLIPSQSPELRYASVHVPTSATYTIWVCGWGGNYGDDSLHMGYADTLQASSDRISGFHPNRWVWSNITMDVVGGVYQPATLAASEGDRVFNVWMREDGMRIDRILLTRSSTFPIATIRCGGY